MITTHPSPRSDLIGRGATAQVYVGRDHMGREAAIKIIRDDLAGDRDIEERLAREAEILGSLNHPALPTLRGFGRDDRGRVYIVMTYGGRQSLESLVASGGALSPRSACAIALQVCQAALYLHEGNLRHGDIKPANVMVDGSGSVLLVDLGLASPIGHGGENIYGTPDYLAPEIIRGRPGGSASDVYAIGALLYFALTAETLFGGESPIDICRQHLDRHPVALTRRAAFSIPPHLDGLIMRALAKAPEARPSIHDLLDGLAAYIPQHGIAA